MLQKNESQNVEYKSVWNDEYLKWICGFANAQGGKLYIGVDDSGHVTGINNAGELLESIPNKISTNNRKRESVYDEMQKNCLKASRIRLSQTLASSQTSICTLKTVWTILKSLSILRRHRFSIMELYTIVPEAPNRNFGEPPCRIS